MITHIYNYPDHEGFSICGWRHNEKEEPFVYISKHFAPNNNNYETNAHHKNHEEYCPRCEDLAPLVMLAHTELE